MIDLESLNREQRRAVEAGDGPLLIVAGPGTGKTKTLTMRIVYLIEHDHVPADHILALTFTKKAAEEMSSRVEHLLGSAKRARPHITTFHALCHELLGGELQFITEPQRLQVIKQLSRPTTLKQMSPRELGLRISRVKNKAEEDEDLTKMVVAYDAALEELGMLDFDDLLTRVDALLSSDETVRNKLHERFRYILVDEFQDTNKLQYDLLQQLRGNDNLFVIGDPLQSIYGFRGASGDIFERFKADFPKAHEIVLTRNYRSAPEVVALSNALFAEAPQLQAHKTTPGTVHAVQVLNEYSEASWVLDEIQRAIGGGDMLRAVSDDDARMHRTLKDFAILYRSRIAAGAMQKALEESGLPYQVVGDGSPYEEAKVQAIIALMKSAQTGEAPHLEGFSAGQSAAIKDLLGQTEGVLPHTLAEKIIALLGFENTLALTQFVGSLVRFTTLAEAVAHFEKIAETTFYDPDVDAITLLTIHASKGLEFPSVFLIGAEEGILPYVGPWQKKDTNKYPDDEERRLFYVATTRAKDQLAILHTTKRAGQPAHLSHFAQELSPEVLPQEVDAHFETDQRRAVKRAIKRSQQTLF